MKPSMNFNTTLFLKKRKNMFDKSLIGTIDSCNTKKDLPCFNKTKTKGMYKLNFIFFLKKNPNQ